MKSMLFKKIVVVIPGIDQILIEGVGFRLTTKNAHACADTHIHNHIHTCVRARAHTHTRARERGGEG